MQGSIFVCFASKLLNEWLRFILEIQWLILVCFTFKPKWKPPINRWLHQQKGKNFRELEKKTKKYSRIFLSKSPTHKKNLTLTPKPKN